VFLFCDRAPGGVIVHHELGGGEGIGVDLFCLLFPP
jgi:hypothetical protein